MNKIEEILSARHGGAVTFRPFFSAEEGGRTEPQSIRITEGGETLQLTALYPDGIRDDFYFTLKDGELTCRRLFRLGGQERDICELGVELNGITFWGEPGDDYFYHNENPRVYEKM